MKYISSLLMTAVFSVICFAAPPKLVVPEKAEVGDVISAKLDGPCLATDWRILDQATGIRINTIPLSDGTLVFGSGAVPRSIIVRVALAYKEGETVSAALLESVVKVGTPDPLPTPSPDPIPTPSPDLPSGKFGLANFVVKSKVGDAKGFAVLAGSFKSIKTQIVAGRFAKLEDVLTATSKANRDALTQAGIPTAQYDSLFSKLQDELFSLYQAKKINTMDDIATAWDEIALGLEKGGK